MQSKPINKILTIVVEKKPTVKATHQYKYIINALAKDTATLTYEDKERVRDYLRVLCALADVSYARVVREVCV